MPNLVSKISSRTTVLCEMTPAQRKPVSAGHPQAVLLFTALSSAILFWASFPPLDLHVLAWIAPLGWLLLVRITSTPRYFYRVLYLAGLAFWLPAIQWLRLGHETMYSAWLALSVYLAIYPPLFVLLCRLCIHQGKLPFLIVAPVVWVSLEYARAHIMGGFPWYFLAHTQYPFESLIQIADLTGSYGISFSILLVTTLLTDLVPDHWLSGHGLVLSPGLITRHSRRRLIVTVVLIAASQLAVLGYGIIRVRQGPFSPGPKVALLQGNIPQTVKMAPESPWDIFQTYQRLSLSAAEEKPDLIIWPESMFRFPLIQVHPDLNDQTLLSHFPENTDPQTLRSLIKDIPALLTRLAQQCGTDLLIGLETIEIKDGKKETYNSAVRVTPEKGLVSRYDKRHLVPFGEYLPFARYLPWLLELTPFHAGYGFDAGKTLDFLELKGFSFSILICYEDTVPHLVRTLLNDAPSLSPAQIQSIKPLDFLVNITNDGWFHDSSELQQHLITSAFRAVESRTPLVRAANTGITAVINGNGKILDQTIVRDPSTRKITEVEGLTVAHIPLDTRTSHYVTWGDWFSGTCLLATVFSSIWSFSRQKPTITLKS